MYHSSSLITLRTKEMSDFDCSVVDSSCNYKYYIKILSNKTFHLLFLRMSCPVKKVHYVNQLSIYQLIDAYKKCPYNESFLSLLLRKGKELNHDKDNKVKR